MGGRRIKRMNIDVLFHHSFTRDVKSRSWHFAASVPNLEARHMILATRSRAGPGVDHYLGIRDAL